jgi:hypothetical protein
MEASAPNNWSYEKYSYNDDQFSGVTGYRYIVGTTGYLTGYNADPSYTANVVWLGLTYKFK